MACVPAASRAPVPPCLRFASAELLHPLLVRHTDTCLLTVANKLVVLSTTHSTAEQRAAASVEARKRQEAAQVLRDAEIQAHRAAAAVELARCKGYIQCEELLREAADALQPCAAAVDATTVAAHPVASNSSSSVSGSKQAAAASELIRTLRKHALDLLPHVTAAKTFVAAQQSREQEYKQQQKMAKEAAEQAEDEAAGVATALAAAAAAAAAEAEAQDP